MPAFKDGTIQQVQTTVGVLWVDPRDQSLGKALARRGEYEPEWTAWIRRVVGPGMKVLDIGANLGYYTVLCAALVGDHGRVVAVEPDAENRELLERNIEANSLAHRVVIHAAALGAESGQCLLYTDSGHRGAHSLSPGNRLSALASVEVPMTTLDALCRLECGGSPDFIKMDAQGAEGAILAGGALTLSAARAMTLMIELWPFGLANCGSSVDEVLEVLATNGFSGARLKRDRPDPIPCGWEEIRSRAAALTGDHASLNLLFTK